MIRELVSEDPSHALDWHIGNADERPPRCQEIYQYFLHKPPRMRGCRRRVLKSDFTWPQCGAYCIGVMCCDAYEYVQSLPTAWLTSNPSATGAMFESRSKSGTMAKYIFMRGSHRACHHPEWISSSRLPLCFTSQCV